MHPNAELLQRLFAAFAAGDHDTIAAALHEDITWETPGRSLLAGRAVGRAAVLAQLARSAELSNGTYRTEVHDIAASDRHAVVLYMGFGERGGRTAELKHAAIYAIDEGRIVAVQALPADQYAFDEFWS